MRLKRFIIALFLFGQSLSIHSQNTVVTQKIENLTCNNWLHTQAAGQCVKLGDLDISGTQITVEATINRTASYTGTYIYAGDIVSKHTNPSDANYLLRPNNAEITTTNGFFQTPEICDIELNKTYHIALVYNGSILKFYRNGFLMSQIPATGNLFQNNLSTTIGDWANYTVPVGSNFLGYINEVRIWNVARTQVDLQAYMDISLPNPTTQTGLQAYYTFDDLANKQGNNTWNGILTGGASINTTNTSCSFVADSCNVSSCNNWLRTSSALSYFTIGDLDISGNKITVEALINRTQPYLPGASNDNEGDVVSKHTDPTDVNYLLRPNHAYITTTNGFFGTPDVCDIELNKTYHIAMVYDGAILKFYRDGFLMSQVAATGNLIQNNFLAQIGHYNASAYNTQFLGYVNEVRIWKVARTQSEIQTFMNTSLPSPATQTGLQAYYTFDNLLNKQGNAAWNGSLTGSATINETNTSCNFTADSCSVINSCYGWLNTPSSSSYVRIGDLDITGTKVTIEASINRTQPYLPGTGDNTEGDVVSKHTDPSNVNYLLRPNHAYVTTTNGFFATPDICEIELNRNYHIAMVYDGSTLKYYRDGALLSQIAAIGNLFQNDFFTQIGYYNATVWNTQFLGYINEVRIWNIARTQTEIKNYMNTSLPNPTTQTGLLAYYTFDNLLNKQGNALYNGTLNGSAIINSSNTVCNFIADSCNYIVPVILTDFKVSVVNNKQINLNWHTEEEINISSYEIERSTNPNAGFAKIGSVTAQKQNVNNYLFIDNNAKQNIIYYYRLAIIENGTIKKYSDIKTAKLSGNDDIIIFNNPSSDLLNIELKQFKAPMQINIYNNLGQMVLQKNISTLNNNRLTIDLSKCPAGNYWLNIHNIDNNITMKIVML